MNKRIEKDIIVTFLKNRKSVTNGEIYNLFSKKSLVLKNPPSTGEYIILLTWD
jgi:hypothetical protein